MFSTVVFRFTASEHAIWIHHRPNYLDHDVWSHNHQMLDRWSSKLFIKLSFETIPDWKWCSQKFAMHGGLTILSWCSQSLSSPIFVDPLWACKAFDSLQFRSMHSDQWTSSQHAKVAIAIVDDHLRKRNIFDEQLKITEWFLKSLQNWLWILQF